MTTSIKTLRVFDAFIDNEVINFKRELEAEMFAISATSWLVEEGGYGGLLATLNFIFELIEREVPGHEMWLFVGQSAWQPDTRIVRYRELWGSLKSRGLEVLGEQFPQSYAGEGNGKVKFFGALRLSRLSVESVLRLMLGERSSYVAVLPSGFDIELALSIGWSGSFAEDLSFLHRVSECGGLLFKCVGEFDDRERGFVSVGQLESMQALWENE
ncbi:hypothetical protein HX866_30460 [Pseudomonas gingeri]|uniref:hypothetical protein n=1 Tax=Pseudomonas gingeri TaxID=117681 RepID=UPI0015A1CB8A|nr:hypothetical protein [Pseudomonas gingeri]NWA29216.1 hypothetical protein [Pseudomonas gingeri]